MLEPRQLGLRRFWYQAGFQSYACLNWNALQPSGYRRIGCVGAPGRVIEWTMDRPGSITGLSVFAEQPAGLGETVRFRVEYTSGGVPALPTDELTLDAWPNYKNWVLWPPGRYTFDVNDSLFITHKTQTTNEYVAQFLLAVVEVSLEG